MPRRTLLAFFLLIITTTTLTAQESSAAGLKKVVIDPGHGGSDPGAISPDGRVREKNITLSVALKLGGLIKKYYPNLKVIYTRETDKFVPLNERSEIANKNRADLFISIHVNSVKNRAVTGSETFIMGADKTNSNLEVTMLENSVILLEGDDYKTKYEGYDPGNPESFIIFSLLQNSHMEQSLEFASLIQKHFQNGPIKANRGVKQGPLLVLWKTSMPSVLVELGFISNQSDLKSLTNPKQQDKFASLIFNAFEEYKTEYEKGVKTSDNKVNKEKREPAIIDESNNQFYSIQIMALGKLLPPDSPHFKGYKPVNTIKIDNLYKYTVGQYENIAQAKDALNTHKKEFKGAFIVVVKENKIIPF